MKYCQHCGKELSDDAVYCTGCGGFNGNPNQGPSQNQYQNQNQNYHRPTSDHNSAGFNVLSFFFPLVGLILFIVWKDQHPIKAKGCGKWALIGFIVNIILSICSSVVTAIM